uniref:Uncharacterized protein n=1 Tax=Lygus hesperus TaxID=30085 RepID=A0A0A9X3N8_LYGHE
MIVQKTPNFSHLQPPKIRSGVLARLTTREMRQSFGFLILYRPIQSGLNAILHEPDILIFRREIFFALRIDPPEDLEDVQDQENGTSAGRPMREADLTTISVPPRRVAPKVGPLPECRMHVKSSTPPSEHRAWQRSPILSLFLNSLHSLLRWFQGSKEVQKYPETTAKYTPRRMRKNIAATDVLCR